MEATELRIGNFVLVDNAKSRLNLLNEPVIVVGINKRDENNLQNSNDTISFEIDKYNGGSQFNEFIKPIELTEEWFLKFGFEKQYPHHPKGFCMLKVDDELYFTFGFTNILNLSKNQYGVILSFKEIKYVHQLQNLYFALTGQELTIKS